MHRTSLVSIALIVMALVAVACDSGPEPEAVTTIAPAPGTVPTTIVEADASTETSDSVPPASTTTAPTTTSTEARFPLRGLAWESVAGGLPFPVFVTSPPGDERPFIVTKDGQIWILDGGSVLEDPFLDIRSLVRNQGEQGLLGMAFHPDYPADGRLFVHYSDSAGDTILAEYRVSGDRDRAESEGSVVFTADQPAGNHNGGMLTFGPDGMLYLGLGDGGGANDRFGNGQRPDTVLGAILRFDVSDPGEAKPAPGNPFLDGDGDPLVWAYGLRNPWRFAIDPVEDLLYIGDVGQNLFEEISVAPMSDAGLNYGWPVTEGLHCFSPSSGCDVESLTLPIIEVEHGDAGTCSITGGVVYRGSAIPELAGHYLYSDYCGGYLRGFRYDQAGAAAQTDWTEEVGVPGQVTSFGTDSAGEVYVTTGGGDVFLLVPIR